MIEGHGLMRQGSKNTEDVKNTIKQLKNTRWNQLTGIYITLHKATTEFTFFWSTHRTFTI